MRKANFPRLALPACQVRTLPLSTLLGRDYVAEEDAKTLERKLLRYPPTKTNTPSSYALKLTMLEGELRIYDDLRELWLVLTPEEWVRQHFVAHLIRDLGYPASLMMNEVSLKIGDMDRRIDTVLYSRRQSQELGRPSMSMIVEYKAPYISLSSEVLEQAVRYNYVTHAGYIIISNGLVHRVYHIDYTTMLSRELSYIPPYREIKHL